MLAQVRHGISRTLRARHVVAQRRRQGVERDRVRGQLQPGRLRVRPRAGTSKDADDPAARVAQFAQDFTALSGERWDYEVCDERTIQLRLADAMEFLETVSYTRNWLSEMQERFCALSFTHWRDLVASVGLEVDERSHTAVMTGAMTRIRADREQRGPASIVLAHCFATGGAASDSERDITVGGVANVPLSVFDGVSYVALGHLHGRQQLSETVRYSGSPVAMSFSEAAHSKGSHLVDIDPATGRTEVTDVAAPVIRRLAVLRGTLEELLSDRRHTDAEDAWVQVVLTDTIRPLGAMDRLRRRFPGVLSLQFDPQGTVTPIRTYAQRVAQRAPLDVCADFLTDVRSGAGPDDAELGLLGRGLEESRRARAARDDEGVAVTTAAVSA